MTGRDVQVLAAVLRGGQLRPRDFVAGFFLRQYPTGGTGISCLRETFARPTSDMPNSWASVRMGVAQIFW